MKERKLFTEALDFPSDLSKRKMFLDYLELKSDFSLVGKKKHRTLAREIQNFSTMTSRVCRYKSLLISLLALFYFNSKKHRLPNWFKNWLAAEVASKKLVLKSADYEELREYWSSEDLVIFSMLLSAENISTYKFEKSEIFFWVNIRKKNGNTFVAITCDNLLVGQCAANFISRNDYLALCSGNIDELIFEVNYLPPQSGNCFLYISVFSIIRQFRNTVTIRMLLTRAKNMLEELARERNELILITVSYTEAGRKLCRLMGMTEVIGSPQHTVYQLRLK